MQLEETAVGGPHLVTNLFVLIIERANLPKRINSLLRVGPAKFRTTWGNLPPTFGLLPSAHCLLPTGHTRARLLQFSLSKGNLNYYSRQ
jgi:hypothetical protein